MTTETEKKQNVRILVVEDDLQFSRIIGLALPGLELPYQFISAVSAGEALALWQKEPFDLVITDYKLPGMNGLRLIEVLKNQGATAPMVLFTAHTDPQIEHDARTLGVANYISKPFAMDQFIDMIRTLLPIKARAVGR